MSLQKPHNMNCAGAGVHVTLVEAEGGCVLCMLPSATLGASSDVLARHEVQSFSQHGGTISCRYMYPPDVSQAARLQCHTEKAANVAREWSRTANRTTHAGTLTTQPKTVASQRHQQNQANLGFNF